MGFLMIKLSQIITLASKEYAKEELGEEPFADNPDAVESITDNFKAGAKFVIDNIMALQNHFPLVGIVTIQVDPNEPDNKLISAKMSGVNPVELVELLRRFSQTTLDKANVREELVLMPKDEARRREAFQKSLAEVRASRELIKPD
jgi:hypothetical protein